NGGAVKAGEVVVQFDATTLRQRTQEKQSELKQADAEIAQMQAQLRITEEQDQAAVMKAKYDLDRARLDLGKRDLVSKLEDEQARHGANIIELPDLSSIHLEARLDESDRGRLKVGQNATVKIEAVPGKDFAATVDLISVLAKMDFSAGWPPLKNFDLGLVLKDPDPRIRPGMTATARIATDRVAAALTAPY